MENSTCCFTGHRPQSLPFRLNEKDKRCVALREKLKAKIEQLITEENVTCFISGMALGIDQICAELVLELKEQHAKITLECAIPCEEQAIKWTEPQRDRYFWIAEQCDKATRKPCSNITMTKSVCKNGTSTWSTIAKSLSPSGTASRAEPEIRSNTLRSRAKR